MNEYERFKGFADVYDKSRPMLPREAIFPYRMSIGIK